MKTIIKLIKIIIYIFIALVFFMLAAIFIILNPMQNVNNNATDNNENVPRFQLSSNDITYDKSNNTSNSSTNTSISNNISSLNTNTATANISNAAREEVINRAKTMAEVKWTPKENIIDKYAIYAFIKGKTYYGIPYSMDSYQVSSVNDFLSKISNSKILYGNDCSGFVSAAWGIRRQTTLTLFNAVKNGSKIEGKTVSEISWNDLKAGDALLLDNGKGKGHIMLYINTDSTNSDKLNVYEQNVQTIIPFQPIPVARKDVRSKSTLIKERYIPIRLMSLG